MRYLPLFIRLRKRDVLVVGGGKVAERKVDLLLRADARLTVVAPEVTPLIRRYHLAGVIRWIEREFRPGDTDDAWLVISAVAEPTVRYQVLKAAHERRLHVNVVDQTRFSDVIVPAIVDRSPIQLAVSSGGTAPVLARRLRERLERLLPPSTGAVAEFVERYRKQIRRMIANPMKRRHFHEWIIDGPVAANIAAGRGKHARTLLLQALHDAGNGAGKGLVSLVGAGPGDPELLTLKALRRLQQADVILHDGLVGGGILELARRDAECISVAKQAGGDGVSQEQINRMLRDHALRGRNVVRLKGGDPLVFGRGGEEMLYLKKWNVPYEVVPGITAAVACAAYAGIPLTHRGLADGASLLTGHCIESRERSDWMELARSRHTLAMYMSVAKLPRIRDELLAHGAAPDTPVAFVENGSRVEQRVIVGKLRDMTELAKSNALGSPAMLFIGATAAFAESLGWFGAEPLRHSVPVPRFAKEKQTGEIRP